MKRLEDMTLTERVKLYACGSKSEEIPAHGFDFSEEDMEDVLSALRIVWLLSRIDVAHNYQAEREDLRCFCVEANGVIRIAKSLVKRCPLKAEFRIKEET